MRQAYGCSPVDELKRRYLSCATSTCAGRDTSCSVPCSPRRYGQATVSSLTSREQHGTPGRGEGHRTRRHRTGPARGDDPRRPRRRRRAGSSSRRTADARRGRRPAAPREARRRPRREERAAASARPGVQGRRAAGLLPARHLRTPRHRARRVRGGEPAADLRAHHRVGSGRAAGDDRRPRHQLPVADRCAERDRLPRPPAGGAAEPGRRLRRWLDVRVARHRRRTLRAGALRQGSGDRRRHGRRGQHPVADDVDDEGDRLAEGSARVVPARRRRAVLPHLRDAPTAGTWPSARSSRSSSPNCSPASA